MAFPSKAYQDIREEEVAGTRLKTYYPRPISLNDMLDRSVAKWPDRECLVFDQERLTFWQFAREVQATAASLAWRRVGNGDRVALLMENRLEFALAYYAVQRVGGIAVVLNARLPADTITFMLRDAGVKLLVTSPEMAALLVSSGKRPPQLEHIVTLGPPPAPDMTAWSTFRESRATAYDRPTDDEDKPAAILYTSGTTGLPKGAIQTHRNVISNAMNAARLLGLSPEDRTLVAVPLFHATGVNSQLSAMLYAGGTSVLRPYFKTDDFIDQLVREQISVAIGVATMFWFMLESPNLAGQDLSRLRHIVYGGSPAPVQLIERLKRQFPAVQLGNVWGLTECTSIATWLPDDAALAKPDSVGLGAPTLEVRVDNPAANGGIGELLVKGPSVIPGYWNNAAASQETLQNGWLKTGDIGRIDDEGYVYVLDRKKDMIIRGGQNIYSIEVENVLYQHPKVLEAAVVGIPDPVWGERVRAFLVAKPGQSVQAEEIREFCQERLARYMVPETVRVVPMLPRNPGGKVLKDALRAMEG